MSNFAIDLVAKHYPNIPREDIRVRLRLATFVNPHRRYMYYEVPKAGCTSIKTLIHRLEGLPPITSAAPEVRRDMFIHSRGQFRLKSLIDLDDATQERMLTSSDVFRFTVVRNPYTRVESAWRDKVRVCAPGFESFYEVLRGGVPDRFTSDNIVTFSEFLSVIETENLETANPHWRLQNCYMFLNALPFNHIGRLEQLQETITEFLKRSGFREHSEHSRLNESVGLTSYDANLAERVFTLYRSDFSAFGYERDMWPRHANAKPITETRLACEIAERNVVIRQLYGQLDEARNQLVPKQLNVPHENFLEVLRTKPFDELFEQYICKVDGYLSREEVSLLYTFARNVGEGGCIVEIGSFRGRSTAALALGSLAGNRVPVYAIEPHEKFVGAFGGTFGPMDRGHFMQVMIETGLFHLVRLINVDSASLGQKWPLPVKLLWIDGDHRYESVQRDFTHWREMLAPDAVVAFDDASGPESGPGRVVNDALATGFKKHLTAGKIVCLSRQRTCAARKQTMEILFFQSADQRKYRHILELTSRTVIEYCCRHRFNYQMFIGVYRGYYAWQATYNRIPLLRRVLESNYAGWVCYLDADAFIADLDFDLPGYLTNKEHIGIIAATDRTMNPDRPYWLINAGSLLINFGHPAGRAIVHSWALQFDAIADEQLKAASEWSQLTNDQDLLQGILRDMPGARECTLTIRGEPNLINYEQGTFIRQILRGDETFEKRTVRIREQTDNVLGLTQTQFA